MLCSEMGTKATRLMHEKLSELLRLNHLKPVYHGDHLQVVPVSMILK